jgi:hypothetical protein
MSQLAQLRRFRDADVKSGSPPIADIRRRDLGTIEYFKRSMDRRVDKFVRQQKRLWDYD